MSMNWPPLTDSLWAATARPAPATPPLKGDIETDVAVIGGGYCGLSTALHLAGHGRDVIVLEAAEPGNGASGRNSGHCVPEWLWQSPDAIVEQYGAQSGERMNEFQSGAAQLVFSLIREHQIECEAVQSGMLKVAKAGVDADGVQVRAEQWLRRGKPVQLITGAALDDYVVSDHFVSGLLFEEGGHINPLGYCRGLADAAIRAGASVHGKSPVTSLASGADGWRLSTPGGTITARTVVIATNAFRGALDPALDRSYTRLHVLGLATDPLPVELRQKVLPGNHNFQEYQARQRYGSRFFFFDAQGRLATGGPIGLGVNTNIEQCNATVGRRLLRAFPQLGELKFSYRWEGFFDVSHNRTVGVHELAPRVYAVVGFSGRGIPTATAMGRDIAQMIVEDSPDAMALPITSLPRNPLGPAREFFWHNMYLPFHRALDRA
jgi:glycine/D-amino acid oxidase-like deaminating enzyme